MSENNSLNPVEISIPVPWGHIAGKAWGDSSHQRVLAIHGKQDNCGAFDRMIKLLKGNYYIIAIDLPGHGFSSHFPPGLFIHMTNYIVAIVDVIKHLNWDRFHLLTHSLGGQIGMFFNALVPRVIDKFIVIDHIAPSYVDDDAAVDYFKRNFNEFVVMEEKLKKGKPPVYSYQVALDKLTNRESVLTDEAAKIILERSLKKIDGGFTFCMDQRIKLHPFPSLSGTFWNNVLRNLNCPTLYIFSSERLPVYEIMFRSSFDIIRKKPNITIKVAKGNHDLHQNHPERVAPLVDEFFSKQRSKSWNTNSEDHVLMVHGIQHNCGSFDRLIRSFKNNYNLLAIDLPSHGRSSHFFEGSPINLFDFVLALKRVTKYLNWTRFCLVGHSFGGQISTYYAAIYPQDVQSLVVIDTMEPRPIPLEGTLSHVQTVLNQQLDLEEKLLAKSAPVYSYDEAYAKVKKNMSWGLTDEAAKDLIERAIKPYKNGYTFTCDQRLKCVVGLRPNLTFEQQKEIVKNISCPVLYILTEGNMTRYGTYLKQMYEYNCSKINNTIIVVKGDHAVHQNHPDRVSHLIDEFLISKRLNSRVEHVTYNGI